MCGFAVAIHPREGTETASSSPSMIGPDVAIHPREGTETKPSAEPASSTLLQFIHARGRKLSLMVPLLLVANHGCNSSPRGDGNSALRPVSREQVVAIHPREGTETCLVFSFLPFFLLQFIPARGRKHHIHQKHVLSNKVAIHPREGTETNLEDADERLRSFVAIHPREGTEARHSAECRDHRTVAIHPREGTKTCTI